VSHYETNKSLFTRESKAYNLYYDLDDLAAITICNTHEYLIYIAEAYGETNDSLLEWTNQIKDLLNEDNKGIVDEIIDFTVNDQNSHPE
jgi:hypothetical protein